MKIYKVYLNPEAFLLGGSEPLEEMPQTPTAANVVLVGKKPVMNYVVACVTYFNQGAGEVIIKARGTSISKAVDVVELLKRSLIQNLEVRRIDIGTQILEREGRQSSVSTIEIAVRKPKT